MKLFLSLFLLIVLVVSGLLFYIDYGSVSVLPILRYEHIEESETKAPNYVHPFAFVRQMKALAEDHFHVIRLSDGVQLYRHGDPIPKHTVAITFDGGYDDFQRHALSILEKYKFPATVFLQSANVGKSGYLNKGQILKMARSGLIQFGSNGQTGRNLSHLGAPDAYGEIFSSRTSLQKDLELPIDFFSYPQGGVNPALERVVLESGYHGACALMPGKRFSNHNPFLMKRTAIFYKDDNPVSFKLKTWGNYVLLKEWKDQRKWL
ncbi:MAG: polysaccharide deacetylase family protein [Chlamydiae bacterium]|nr:polysaccharide deacetylase family protein [Chlamydiota bacterium]MBI3266531.1 polysaccharide deacetylase family protein [Chlamydiota bacterium]